MKGDYNVRRSNLGGQAVRDDPHMKRDYTCHLRGIKFFVVRDDSQMKGDLYLEMLRCAQHDNRGFSVTVGSVTVGDDSQMEGKLHHGRDNPIAERRWLAE